MGSQENNLLFELRIAPFDHPQLIIANGVEIPAVGANGGLALQPFASKLPR